MGTKQETTSRVQQKNPMQREIEQMYMGASQSALDQMNLGGLASGQMPELTPEIMALINQSVGGQADISRRQINADYEDAERDMRTNLLKRGQGDTSYEGISQAVLGRDRARQLANIESQRSGSASQAMLALPFQTAQQQLSANQLLLQQLGAANPVLNAYQQTRMANSTGTTNTSGAGNTIGQFSSIGMGLASGGAFGAGGAFGKAQ